MSSSVGSTGRLDRDRLAIAVFVVLVAVFAGMRFLDVQPWTAPAFDVWAYWLTRDGPDYAALAPGQTGAYLYSPAFAQAILPLTSLPWPAFAGLWTVLAVAPLPWLTGRYAVVLCLLPPVAMSIALGQLDFAFAGVAVLGFRWPALWALPVLTKITPGVGLVWFLVRREWRSLAIAGGVTLAITATSWLLDPAAWAGWIDLLRRGEFPALGNGLVYLPISPWIRAPAAAILVAWGGLTDRRWTVPVGMCLALPTVWVNSVTILVALLPLTRDGHGTPAGAWLRSHAEDRVAKRA